MKDVLTFLGAVVFFGVALCLLDSIGLRLPPWAWMVIVAATWFTVRHFNIV